MPWRAARELLQPVRDGGDRVRVRRGRAQLPGHQRRDRPRTRRAAQLVAIHLRDDLHDAPINRVALTGQLRQLLKQHLKTLSRAHSRGRRCGRGHDSIIAARYDKFRLPSPRRSVVAIKCQGIQPDWPPTAPQPGFARPKRPLADKLQRLSCALPAMSVWSCARRSAVCDCSAMDLTPGQYVLRKLPHITALFWAQKILATTLGETAGDLLLPVAGAGHPAQRGAAARHLRRLP